MTTTVTTPIAEPAVVLGKGSGRDLRFCVSLWDNERAQPHLATLQALQAEASPSLPLFEGL